MPSSIQNRAKYGEDYVSIIDDGKGIKRYACLYCSFRTSSKTKQTLYDDEPKRNAVNRIRGEIMRHVRDKHFE